MKQSYIKQLFAKFLKKDISPLEESILERLDHEMIKAKKNSEIADKEEIWRFVNRRISYEQPIKLRWSGFYRIAASIAIVLGLSTVLYLALDQNNPQPGKLTIISTEWGQKNKVTLSDGTTVHLNSGSTLEFPEKFNGQIRNVDLSGEAFFVVAPNPKKPFVVHSGEVTTKVLGTSFNIKAYPDNQEISVTVATGKVQVSELKSSLDLLPNEQAVFSKDDKTLQSFEVDAGKFSNWKDGIIDFDRASLAEVAKTLQQWFGIEIIFENDNLRNCRLTGTYQNESLAEILASIGYVKKNMEIEYRGKDSIVFKGTCEK